MSFRPSLLPPIVFWAASVWLPIHAQEPSPQADGVFRTEFAEVLRVEPVYPGGDERRVSSHCVNAASSQGREQRALLQPLSPPPPPSQRGREDVDKVVFSADVECATIPVEVTGSDSLLPIAWDVDYILRGVKYRSRLPYDPGGRVRVRVSVTPVLAPADARDPP